MKKHTAHSLTLKHKHAKHMKGGFAANRREEELEDEGKAKHMKHRKHHKHYKMESNPGKKGEVEQQMKRKHHKMEVNAGRSGEVEQQMKRCKSCGSMKHASHEHMKHMKRRKAAVEQTAAARFERMRKKVFGLK